MKLKMKTKTYNVFAAHNVYVDGQRYITGMAIRNTKGKLRTYKTYGTAAKFCRDHFGAQWPSVLEIS